MKRRKNDYIVFTFRKFIFLICLIVLFFIGSFIFIKNDLKFGEVPRLGYISTQTIPTLIPTPTLDPNRPGFHGYDEEGQWFDLALPPECLLEKIQQTYRQIKKINCITNDFTIIINPEALGRGAIVVEQKEITLNGFTWTKRVIDPNSERPTTVTYSLLRADNHPKLETSYLLEVQFEPFTSESQQYFETILGSFHFLE